MSLSHDDLVRQEQERQAKALVQTKEQAAILRAKAQKVVEQVRRSEYDLRQWQQTWTAEVRPIIRAIHQRNFDGAKEEFEYDKETNPNAKMPSVNFLDAVNDGFAQWWDDKKDRLAWDDARHRLEEYMDAHNRTESSDDMSRLQAENDMLKHFYRGGFGSMTEMDQSLDLISSYINDLNHYMDGGWSSVGATAIELVTAGVPMILMYCKTLDSIKSESGG